MEYMLMPIRRYADFSGRSRRMEYWMFVLFSILAMIVLGCIGAILDVSMGNFAEGRFPVMFFSLVMLLSLFLFIPSIAVQVRRFHDQDKSGWMILLGLIPSVGGLIVLVFMCLDGTRGENSYGPDPKGYDPGNMVDVFR